MATAVADSPSAVRSFYSPPQIAELLGIDVGKCLDWIHSGELPASNIATVTGGRPRWRISAADLDAFLERRKPQSAAKPARRRKPSGYQPKYYK